MAKETIVIIDYGSGNIASAAKAFEHVIAARGLNAQVQISGKAEDVLRADRVVLPGQGAFADCKSNLENTEGMIEALEARVVQGGAPFLGICVGMQLMATRGLEHGVSAGLDWVPGQVVPLKPHTPPQETALKIPHMGWNEIVLPNSGGQDNRHPILKSMVQGSTDNGQESQDHYYFVHSFMFECEYNHHVLGLCDYGGLFPAIVGRDNMVGVQFHPEKSQDAGLRLLSDFMAWKP